MYIYNLIDRRSGGGAEKICYLLRKHVAHDVVNLYVFNTGAISSEENDTIPGSSLFTKALYLVNYFRSRKDCIIHSHLGKALYLFAFIKFIYGPRVIHIHTEHNTYNRRRKWVFYFIEYLAYSNVDKVVCISRATESALVKFLPSTACKSEIIYNGVELLPQPEFLKGGSEVIKLLNVGSHTSQKNVELLIRLMGVLPNNYQLTLVGEGDLTLGLKNLVDLLDLSGRVIFQGWQDDIAPYYIESDLLLIPSKWEGFGLVAVEAAAYGLPVIGANVGGLDEVIVEFDFCSLVTKPEDVESWATMIMSSVKKRDLSERQVVKLGQQARKFDISNMTRGYTEIYEKSFDLLR